jgi:hypothetical protein
MPLKFERDARKRINQPAWITLEGGFAARKCTVVDQSADGLKIVVEDPSALQKRFQLSFTRDARAGVTCEVAWRRGNTFGIKFVE